MVARLLLFLERRVLLLLDANEPQGAEGREDRRARPDHDTG
jgi:hypothetical protein